MREWLMASYVVALVKRFFALEILDRAFGLAAQAFLPGGVELGRQRGHGA